MEVYSNVSRDGPPPPEPERPRKSRRGGGPKRQPSTDRVDEEPPPVPDKDPELLREITNNAHVNSEQTQPPLMKPVPKKRKNIPGRDVDPPAKVKGQDITTPTATSPSIDNPFYDGVIFLQPPPKGRVDSKKEQDVSDNGPNNKAGAKPQKISAKMSGPTRYMEYELAGAAPDLDHSVGIEEQSETESDPHVESAPASRKPKGKGAPKSGKTRSTAAGQQIETETSPLLDAATGKTAATKPKESTGAGRPLESIIVDKYFYNFIWTFKSGDVAGIQDSCKLVIKEVGGRNKRDIEVKFKLKDTKTSIAEPEKQFIDLYNRVKQTLVVESVNVAQVKDVREMQNELENVYESLCFNVDDKQMDIVCDQKNQKQIKRCIAKHGGLSIVGAPQLHSNPDIAGPGPKSGKTDGNFSPVTYNINNAFKLHIYEADITRLGVDAVVNAANGFLRHGSGIARAILKAGGPQIDKEGKELLKKRHEIPVSQVVRTTGGQLPARMVLHAVGPRWPSKKDRNAQHNCVETLITTFDNVLISANENGARSVAIPPISSGVFGVPKETVAWALHSALVDASTRRTHDQGWTVEDIHVVDIAAPVLTELNRLFSETTNFETRGGQLVAVEEIQVSASPKITEAVPVVTERVPPVATPNRSTSVIAATGLEHPVGFILGLAYRVYIYNADITKLNVDAVVNSTNTDFSLGSGVSRSISNAAGNELSKAAQEILRKRKRLATCEVVKTSAGQLPCRMVLHAVGPVWPEHRRDQQEQCLMELRQTFDNVLAAANKHGAKSIAIPTISSGRAAIPVEKVAVALHASLVKGADPDTLHPKAKLKEIHVVDVTDAVLVELAGLFDDGGMIRAASGKMVAITELERQEIKIASNDRHRQLIGASPAGTLRQKKKGKGNFFKNLCGGGSHKEV